MKIEELFRMINALISFHQEKIDEQFMKGNEFSIFESTRYHEGVIGGLEELRYLINKRHPGEE